MTRYERPGDLRSNPHATRTRNNATRTQPGPELTNPRNPALPYPPGTHQNHPHYTIRSLYGPNDTGTPLVGTRTRFMDRNSSPGMNGGRTGPSRVPHAPARPGTMPWGRVDAQGLISLSSSSLGMLLH